MKHSTRFLIAMCLCASAGVAFGQSVQMSTGPLKIKPSGQVGNKIRIKWTVTAKSAVLLQVIDKDGRVVRTIDAGDMAPEEYNAIFDGTDGEGKTLPPGKYTVRLSAGLKPEPDLSFGTGGVVGRGARASEFKGNRTIELGAQNVDATTVGVKVDGEAWDREQDFSLAGNNFTLDAAKGVVTLNPSGTISEGANLEVSYGMGVPAENPWAVAVAPDGSIFLADNLMQLDAANKKPKPRNGHVYKLDVTGKAIADFGAGGALETPCLDIAADAAGDLMVVAAYHTVVVYDAKGVHKTDLVGYVDPYRKNKKPGEVEGGYWIKSIALGRPDRLFVINGNQSNVVYDPNKPNMEGFLAIQGAEQGAQLPPVYWQYYGPCVAAVGDCFYQTTSNHNIVKARYDEKTHEVKVVWATPVGDPVGGTDQSPAGLWHAMGIAADKSGLLYVADRNNHRIQVFFDAGDTYKHVGIFGSNGSDITKLQMVAPHALALGDGGRQLYIVDDGFFFAHQKQPVVKGLARLTRVKLGCAEKVEAPLTVE